MLQILNSILSKYASPSSFIWRLHHFDIAENFLHKDFLVGRSKNSTEFSYQFVVSAGTKVYVGWREHMTYLIVSPTLSPEPVFT